MGKIIHFVTVSLDGYFEGPNHDLSWFEPDDEYNSFAIDELHQEDAILFGRRCYQLFEEFWPKVADDPMTSRQDLEIAHLINNMKKIVYSRTLKKVEENNNWKNVTLVHEINPEEVSALKRQTSKNISVGGNSLALSFAQMGLIDEFWIMVYPVAIGSGTPLLFGLKKKLKLKHLGTTTFKSGNVLLCYEPADR
jgi:dihydrofolate reductase